MNSISFKLKDGYFYISKCVLKASRPAWEIYSQSEKSAKIIASVLRPSPPSVRRDRQPLSFARSAAVDIFGLWPGAAISPSSSSSSSSRSCDCQGRRLPRNQSSLEVPVVGQCLGSGLGAKTVKKMCCKRPQYSLG